MNPSDLPQLIDARARAAEAVQRLAGQGRTLVLTLTPAQRGGVLVFGIAVLVALVDAVLGRLLPPGLLPSGLHAVSPAVASVAGSALLLASTRFWLPGLAPGTVGAAPEAPVCIAPPVGAEAIAEAAPDPDPEPAALAAPDTRPPADVLDRTGHELAQFPIFTRIMSSQLASVVTLSDDAAQNIMAGLSRVDTEVTNLMALIRTSDAGVGVGDIVRGIETKVGACVGLLQQFTDRQAETSRREAELRVQLESESQAVLRIVDGVRRIAQQSNILSFNIAIESGHLGNKDNGFVFIADQVRKLAQDVDKLAGRLSGQIGDIMQRVIVDSEAMALTRQAAEAADLADLSTALGELNGDFDTLVGHQRDVLAKVADSSEAVAAPILAMMGSVQFQDITRQQIEQLTTTVGKVDTRIAQLADTLQTGAEETPAPDMTELLDGLFDSYVMDGQRGAHLAAKGDDAPVASGALIELF